MSQRVLGFLYVCLLTFGVCVTFFAAGYNTGYNQPGEPPIYHPCDCCPDCRYTPLTVTFEECPV